MCHIVTVHKSNLPPSEHARSLEKVPVFVIKTLAERLKQSKLQHLASLAPATTQASQTSSTVDRQNEFEDWKFLSDC